MRRERENEDLMRLESWESWISEEESGSNFVVLKTVAEKEVALL
jgi:hypothetical protein